MDSLRAPGRAPEIASAAATMNASGEAMGMSSWCAATQWITSGRTLNRLQISTPISTCVPVTSWSSAFPRSCKRHPSTTVIASAPISSASMRPICAISTECLSTFPVARTEPQPPDDLEQVGRVSRDAELICRAFAELEHHLRDLLLHLCHNFLDARGL